MELCDLHEQDALRGWQLTQAVGWGHSQEDWARLLRQGIGYGMCDGDTLAASGIAIPYGQARAWINMVITHPEYQRRGLSSAIMRELIAELERRGVREIWLDASAAGKPVYDRLGFREMGKVELWSGSGQAFAVEVSPIDAQNLAQVIAYDAAVFGVARPQVITDWVRDNPDKVFVDGTQGIVLARQGSADWGAVCFWEHDTPAGAEKLLQAALNTLVGCTVNVFVPDYNLAAKTILEKYGFGYLRHCTRMLYGDVIPVAGDPARYYGAGTFALG